MSHHQHINYKTTTKPTTEPVTLAEAKANMKVTNTAEDAQITDMIVAAREWCEGFANRAYMTQTITLKMDFFEKQIEIPRSPLLSVDSIKYIDTAGDEQTLDASIYDVDTISEPGLVTLEYNQSWPATRRQHHAVEIIYKAGYNSTPTNADDVPQRVKRSILLLVTHFYQNRSEVCGDQKYEVPHGVESQLWIDRCFA